MGPWMRKKDLPDGDRLVKIIDRKTRRTIFLPMKMRGRTKQNLNTIELYQYKKKYPSLRINFNSKVTAEALDGKKILITIEVIN